jgi:hypothetical protein
VLHELRAAARQLRRARLSLAQFIGGTTFDPGHSISSFVQEAGSLKPVPPSPAKAVSAAVAVATVRPSQDGRLAVADFTDALRSLKHIVASPTVAVHVVAEAVHIPVVVVAVGTHVASDVLQADSAAASDAAVAPAMSAND